MYTTISINKKGITFTTTYFLIVLNYGTVHLVCFITHTSLLDT